MEKEDFDRWLVLRDTLCKVKKEEAELRAVVGAAVMGEQKTGSAHAELFNRELKASRPLNYTVDPGCQYNHEITNEEKQCVNWKPSLILKEWNKLTEEQRANLSPYVTTKPGSLSVEVGEPVQ